MSSLCFHGVKLRVLVCLSRCLRFSFFLFLSLSLPLSLSPFLLQWRCDRATLGSYNWTCFSDERVVEAKGTAIAVGLSFSWIEPGDSRLHFPKPPMVVLRATNHWSSQPRRRKKTPQFVGCVTWMNGIERVCSHMFSLYWLAMLVKMNLDNCIQNAIAVSRGRSRCFWWLRSATIVLGWVL